MAGARAKPQHDRPEGGSRRAPGPESSADNAPTATKGATKAAAAKAALDEGIEGPQEAVGFIKKRFGIEMNPQYFSAVKGQLKKKDGGASKEKPGRKPKAAPGQDVGGYPAPPAPRPADTDLIDSLETLKPLIAQYGPEKVKRLVDLLG